MIVKKESGHVMLYLKPEEVDIIRLVKNGNIRAVLSTVGCGEFDPDTAIVSETYEGQIVIICRRRRE